MLNNLYVYLFLDMQTIIFIICIKFNIQMNAVMKTALNQTASRSNTSELVNRFDLPSVDSQQLMAGKKRIRIHHQGENYELRITKLGKLILTK